MFHLLHFFTFSFQRKLSLVPTYYGMPSRKRNQGKARKAKALAGSETEAGWCADEENKLNLLFKGISLKDRQFQCSHGHPYLPRGHICTKFMVAFETDLKRLISEHGPYLAGQKAFADSLEKVPLEQEHMQCVLDCLLSLGTDYLLEAIVNKKRNHFIHKIVCQIVYISGIYCYVMYLCSTLLE